MDRERERERGRGGRRREEAKASIGVHCASGLVCLSVDELRSEDEEDHSTEHCPGKAFGATRCAP